MRLARLHYRISALNEMQYRINFWIQLVNSLLALGTGLVAIAVVYDHTTSLGGWGSAELLGVLAVHMIVGGFLRTFVIPNMWQLVSDIQEGTLDYLLTRPADSQLIVSVRQVNLWKVIDIVLGVGVLVWALRQMEIAPGITGSIGLIGAFFAGSLILYAIWLTAVTLAFKAIDIGNLMQLLDSVYEAGRWPVGVYPLWLQSTLTVVVPLAFAVTIPAELVAGRIAWWWLAIAIGVAVLALLICRRVWFWGIKNYSGASA